eukprot:jgi/Mesvir1/170/Mv13527-RA.2
MPPQASTLGPGMHKTGKPSSVGCSHGLLDLLPPPPKKLAGKPSSPTSSALMPAPSPDDARLALNTSASQGGSGGSSMTAPGPSQTPEQVLAAMRRHLADATVQEDGCMALIFMAVSHRSAVERILKADGVRTVVDALLSHNRSTRLVTKACGVLIELATRSSIARAEIVTYGGVAALVAALSTHRGDSAVQEWGCRTFACVSLDDGSRAAMAEEAEATEGGCISLCVDVLRCHRGQPRTCEWACRTLALLACNQNARAATAEWGGVDALVAVLGDAAEMAGPGGDSNNAAAANAGDHHTRMGSSAGKDGARRGSYGGHGMGVDEGGHEPVAVPLGGSVAGAGVASVTSRREWAALAEWACRALLEVGVAKANRALLVEAGGVSVLCRAMATHAAVPEVQKCGCILIGGIMAELGSAGASVTKANNSNTPGAGSQQQQQIMDASQGPGAAVVHALLHHHTLPSVAEHGCRSIAALAVDEANALWLANNGGVVVVIDVLRAHADPVIVEQGCRAMGALAAHDGIKPLIAEEGGVVAVVAVLLAHAKSKEAGAVAEWACGALLNLTASSICREVIVANRGILGIVAAMKTHQALPGVQHKGCGALGNIAATERNQRLVADARGVRAVVRALRVHRKNARVCEMAAFALAALAGSDDNRVRIAADGGLVALVDVLETQADKPPVIEMACLALMRLSTGSPGNRAAIAAYGGNGKVLAAAARHQDVPSVQARAFSVLACSAKDPKLRATIASEGAVDLVVASMRAHADSSDVQEWALRALHRMLAMPQGGKPGSRDDNSKVSKGVAGLLSLTGGLPVVVEAMLSHPSHEVVQEEGAGVLAAFALAAPTTDRGPSLVFDAGAVVAVTMAMEAHGARRGVVHNAARVLYVLASDPEVRTKLAGASLGVVPALLAVLHAQPQDPRAALDTLSVLRALSQDNSHSASSLSATPSQQNNNNATPSGPGDGAHGGPPTSGAAALLAHKGLPDALVRFVRTAVGAGLHRQDRQVALAVDGARQVLSNLAQVDPELTPHLAAAGLTGTSIGAGPAPSPLSESISSLMSSPRPGGQMPAGTNAATADRTSAGSSLGSWPPPLGRKDLGRDGASYGKKDAKDAYGGGTSASLDNDDDLSSADISFGRGLGEMESFASSSGVGSGMGGGRPPMASIREEAPSKERSSKEGAKERAREEGPSGPGGAGNGAPSSAGRSSLSKGVPATTAASAAAAVAAASCSLDESASAMSAGGGGSSRTSLSSSKVPPLPASATAGMPGVAAGASGSSSRPGSARNSVSGAASGATSTICIPSLVAATTIAGGDVAAASAVATSRLSASSRQGSVSAGGRATAGATSVTATATDASTVVNDDGREGKGAGAAVTAAAVTAAVAATVAAASPRSAGSKTSVERALETQALAQAAEQALGSKQTQALASPVPESGPSGIVPAQTGGPSWTVSGGAVLAASGTVTSVASAISGGSVTGASKGSPATSASSAAEGGSRRDSGGVTVTSSGDKGGVSAGRVRAVMTTTVSPIIGRVGVPPGMTSTVSSGMAPGAGAGARGLGAAAGREAAGNKLDSGGSQVGEQMGDNDDDKVTDGSEGQEDGEDIFASPRAEDITTAGAGGADDTFADTNAVFATPVGKLGVSSRESMQSSREEELSFARSSLGITRDDDEAFDSVDSISGPAGVGPPAPPGGDREKGAVPAAIIIPPTAGEPAQQPHPPQASPGSLLQRFSGILSSVTPAPMVAAASGVSPRAAAPTSAAVTRSGATQAAATTTAAAAAAAATAVGSANGPASGSGAKAGVASQGNLFRGSYEALPVSPTASVSPRFAAAVTTTAAASVASATSNSTIGTGLHLSGGDGKVPAASADSLRPEPVAATASVQQASEGASRPAAGAAATANQGSVTEGAVYRDAAQTPARALGARATAGMEENSLNTPLLTLAHGVAQQEPGETSSQATKHQSVLQVARKDQAQSQGEVNQVGNEGQEGKEGQEADLGPPSPASDSSVDFATPSLYVAATMVKEVQSVMAAEAHKMTGGQDGGGKGESTVVSGGRDAVTTAGMEENSLNTPLLTLAHGVAQQEPGETSSQATKHQSVLQVARKDQAQSQGEVNQVGNEGQEGKEGQEADLGPPSPASDSSVDFATPSLYVAATMVKEVHSVMAAEAHKMTGGQDGGGKGESVVSGGRDAVTTTRTDVGADGSHTKASSLALPSSAAADDADARHDAPRTLPGIVTTGAHKDGKEGAARPQEGASLGGSPGGVWADARDREDSDDNDDGGDMSKGGRKGEEGDSAGATPRVPLPLPTGGAFNGDDDDDAGADQIAAGFNAGGGYRDVSAGLRDVVASVGDKWQMQDVSTGVGGGVADASSDVVLWPVFGGKHSMDATRGDETRWGATTGDASALGLTSDSIIVDGRDEGTAGGGKRGGEKGVDKASGWVTAAGSTSGHAREARDATAGAQGDMVQAIDDAHDAAVTLDALEELSAVGGDELRSVLGEGGAGLDVDDDDDSDDDSVDGGKVAGATAGRNDHRKAVASSFSVEGAAGSLEKQLSLTPQPVAAATPRGHLDVAAAIQVAGREGMSAAASAQSVATPALDSAVHAATRRADRDGTGAGGDGEAHEAGWDQAGEPAGAGVEGGATPLEKTPLRSPLMELDSLGSAIRFRDPDASLQDEDSLEESSSLALGRGITLGLGLDLGQDGGREWRHGQGPNLRYLGGRDGGGSETGSGGDVSLNSSLSFPPLVAGGGDSVNATRGSTRLLSPLPPSSLSPPGSGQSPPGGRNGKHGQGYVRQQEQDSRGLELDSISHNRGGHAHSPPGGGGHSLSYAQALLHASSVASAPGVSGASSSSVVFSHDHPGQGGGDTSASIDLQGPLLDASFNAMVEKGIGGREGRDGGGGRDSQGRAVRESSFGAVFADMSSIVAGGDGGGGKNSTFGNASLQLPPTEASFLGGPPGSAARPSGSKEKGLKEGDAKHGGGLKEPLVAGDRVGVTNVGNPWDPPGVGGSLSFAAGIGADISEGSLVAGDVTAASRVGGAAPGSRPPSTARQAGVKSHPPGDLDPGREFHPATDLHPGQGDPGVRARGQGLPDLDPFHQRDMFLDGALDEASFPLDPGAELRSLEFASSINTPRTSPGGSPTKGKGVAAGLSKWWYNQ